MSQGKTQNRKLGSPQLAFLQCEKHKMEAQETGKPGNQGGRPADPIWKFFIRDPPLGGPQTAGKVSGIHGTCLECKVRFLVRSNDALYSHILEKCKLVKEETRSEVLKMVEDKETKPAAGKKRKTAPVEGQADSAAQVDRINQAVLLFFAGSKIPPNLVENPSFINLLRVLRPQYKPPGVGCNLLVSGGLGVMITSKHATQ